MDNSRSGCFWGLARGCVLGRGVVGGLAVGVAWKQRTRLTGRRRTIVVSRYPTLPSPAIGRAWPHYGPGNGIDAARQNPTTPKPPPGPRHAPRKRKNPRGLAGGFVAVGVGLVRQPMGYREPDGHAGDDARD